MYYNGLNTIIDKIYSKIKKKRHVKIKIKETQVISLFISLFLAKQIFRPIDKVVNSMKKIAEKQIDFRIEEHRNDEIGKLFSSINKININFREILTNLNDTAITVLDASSQLNSASQDVSERANEQAATTEEIASSMEEMLVVIESNTEKAKHTEDIVTKSVTDLETGNEIFLRTIKAVSDISKKASVISDIAFQTNILSLNASIQAAKAGTAGKGFSVVADEIRTLADKSKYSSEEINELSEIGKLVSKEAKEKFEKIMPEIKKSSNLVNFIASASKEQQKGLENINISIQQLTEITNKNSASAEEMSASAEELSTQAEQLKSLISVFEISNLQTIKIKTHPKRHQNIKLKKDTKPQKTRIYKLNMFKRGKLVGN